MHWDFATNGFVHICGHRGHSTGAPENTISAFRATRALGGTTAEIDTVLTADGEIVLMHDLSVDRTTDGSGVVADMPLAAIRKLDAGSWFTPDFAGERVLTLTEALAIARDLNLGFEVEVKERRDLPRYARQLAEVLEDPADMERVMMISFDHAWLYWLKTQIPGIKTGGIIHARHTDPIRVATSAGLDQLSIDLSVWHPDDALQLHDAGIVNRCHAYAPTMIERLNRAGLDPLPSLRDWLAGELIDTLSGDDVGWVAAVVARAGVAPDGPSS
jgi:glycerophosphoryl diester phosphodiesterase